MIMIIKDEKILDTKRYDDEFVGDCSKIKTAIGKMRKIRRLYV